MHKTDQNQGICYITIAYCYVTKSNHTVATMQAAQFLRGSQRKINDIFIWSKTHEQLEKRAGNGNLQRAMNPALGKEERAEVIARSLLLYWKCANAENNCLVNTTRPLGIKPRNKAAQKQNKILY